MHTQTNSFLPVAIVIGGVLVAIAALIMVLSPMLWTDHLVTRTDTRIPAGCSIQMPLSATAYGVARCPTWVQWVP